MRRDLFAHLHHGEQGHGSDASQKAEELAEGRPGSFLL